MPLLRFCLNLRQSRLESARGAVMAAAHAHGDSPKATRLWQLAIELTSLRDKEVADAYERQRLRAARGEAGAHSESA